MDCGHGWRHDTDCDVCRPPAVVVAGLRGRISELEAALRRINAINDHPGRFSREIQDVLDSVIDTSDAKFT